VPDMPTRATRSSETMQILSSFRVLFVTTALMGFVPACDEDEVSDRIAEDDEDGDDACACGGQKPPKGEKPADGEGHPLPPPGCAPPVDAEGNPLPPPACGESPVDAEGNALLDPEGDPLPPVACDEEGHPLPPPHCDAEARPSPGCGESPVDAEGNVLLDPEGDPLPPVECDEQGRPLPPPGGHGGQPHGACGDRPPEGECACEDEGE
jgi:hypothetical protein